MKNKTKWKKCSQIYLHLARNSWLVSDFVDGEAQLKQDNQQNSRPLVILQNLIRLDKKNFFSIIFHRSRRLLPCQANFRRCVVYRRCRRRRPRGIDFLEEPSPSSSVNVCLFTTSAVRVCVCVRLFLPLVPVP